MAQIKLTDRPGSRAQIAHAFFGTSSFDGHLDELQGFFTYYQQELQLLRKGISTESWQSEYLAIKTYEDIFYVVDVLHSHGDSRRPEIRSLLSPRFPSSNMLGLNCSINLAIRLWLMINAQEIRFEGLRHETTSVQWNDECTLREWLQSLFPHARWDVTPQSNRFGPYFTVAFMQRVCGLKVQWTTSLHDHLRLDLQRKSLKVFPYKTQLQVMIRRHQSQGQTRYAWYASFCHIRS
jgi:hypothetical protein